MTQIYIINMKLWWYLDTIEKERSFGIGLYIITIDLNFSCSMYSVNTLFNTYIQLSYSSCSVCILWNDICRKDVYCLGAATLRIPSGGSVYSVQWTVWTGLHSLHCLHCTQQETGVWLLWRVMYWGRAQTKTNIRQNIPRIFCYLSYTPKSAEYLPNISPNICLCLSPILRLLQSPCCAQPWKT